MAKADEYQVTIKGPGLQLDRKVDGESARAIVGLIFGTASPLSRGTGAGTGIHQKGRVADPASPVVPPVDGGPELSVAEFLQQHKASRNVDKIACIAAYLKHQRRQQTFTRDDVVRMFEAAREPVPGNVPRDLTWTAKVGWIAPSSQNENEYYLTRSGEDVVNKNFPDDVKQKTKIGGRPAKKSKGKTATRNSA